jgi:hypothetical protein
LSEPSKISDLFRRRRKACGVLGGLRVEVLRAGAGARRRSRHCHHLMISEAKHLAPITPMTPILVEHDVSAGVGIWSASRFVRPWPSGPCRDAVVDINEAKWLSP